MRPAFLLAFVLAMGLPAMAAKAPPDLPVEAFGSLPLVADVQIAPDGRHAAAIMLNNGKYGVVIYDLEAIGKKPPLVASPGDWDVKWIHWKSANRLLISARFANRRYGTAVTETRLVAMNADGSDLQYVVQPKKAEVEADQIVQIQDEVVSFLPDDPKRVMLAFNPEDPARPRLYKVDIYNSRRETIETGRATIQEWLLDQQGRVRIAQGRDVTNSRGGNFKTYYRAKVDGDWAEFWDAGERSNLQPVAFDRSDPDVVWVISDHEDGRDGLYRLRLSSREFIETIFHDPKVDIDQVYLSPRGDEVEGYSYVTDVVHERWLSPRMSALSDDLQKALPGWVVHIRSRSDQDQQIIVSASASDHSQRFYLYEPQTKKLKLFSFTYPDLDKYDLARVVHFSYKARDGLEIPAYLTLPVGVANPPGTPLPAVVYPHGGPEVRDYAEFEPFVQMFVNRGYAVLQMNYRGSSGFGTEFQLAGRQAWGEAMQDDVTDGTRWLVEQKIADPSRICILGASYGGYAALMGAVKEPKLYRCAISFAGVSDLPDLISYEMDFVGGRGAAYQQIGGLWSDREQLARNSPARHADRIEIPVLLLHGTDDRTVSINQTRKMASALKAADKKYRYVELEDEDHGLSHNATRLQAFREVDAFLAEQLK